MYRLTSKLLLYRDMENESILSKLSAIFDDFDNNRASAHELTDRIYTQIHRLLKLSTQYGFDNNLWQDYLVYILLMHENPFTLVYENSRSQEGTVNELAKNDFRLIKQLIDYDFSRIEKELGIDCFSTIRHYKALRKREQMYYRHVSEAVRKVSEQISSASDDNEIFGIVTRFYMENGVGLFGLNKSFRYHEGVFTPVNNMDNVLLDDLIGYELQKKELIDNTEAFVEGRPANNVLLYGDRGTGKSSSIKAVANQFYHRGLRLIEVYRNQLDELSDIIAKIKSRNYYFVIYMDDLSFEEFETDYKYLKAVIEGGAETKPDNVLIYATSNRRHLIRETWSDRDDISSKDIHRTDTMQEKLSLADRFGITINFPRPDREEFFKIVTELASRYPSIRLTREELIAEAGKWEMWHSGISGRTARQFINYLLGSLKGD